MLLTPKKVLLDTGHLIELSKIQRGIQSHVDRQPPDETFARRKLLDAIKMGAVVPVIGFEQVFEWCPEGNAKPGLEIARVLDMAPACYETTDMVFAIMVEVVAEAQRLFGLSGPTLPPPIHLITESDHVSMFLRRQIPSVADAWRRTEGAALERKWDAIRVPLKSRGYSSVANMVELDASVCFEQRAQAREARDVFRLGFSQTKDSLQGGRIDARQETIDRLRRVPVLIELLDSVGLADRLDQLWQDAEFCRCPTIDLWSRMWMGYVSNKPEANANDFVDISLLPAYAYSDFALTERNMCHHVRNADTKYRGRVFRSAREIVGALSL